MKSKRFLLIVLLSLIGLGLSGTLLYQHYRLYLHGFGEKSFCTINQWINCDVVNGSSYAELLGIPLAGWGLAFYLALLVNTLLGGLGEKPKREMLAFGFVMSIAGLLFTFYPAAISAFKLHAVCLLCAGLYLVSLLLVAFYPWALEMNAGTFLTEYAAALRKHKNNLDFKPQFVKCSLLTMLVIALGIGGVYAAGEAVAKKTAGQGNKRPDDIPTLVKLHFSQAPAELDAGNRPAWGNPNAKVKIVEFSDFQCPYCRMAAENLKPALTEYKNDVAFYFVNYPLDQSCNVYVSRPMHENACNAAKAGVCAATKGKFWEIHDVIFGNQKKLSSGDLVSYGEQVGLNKDEMMSCMFQDSTLQTIKDDIEFGKTAGISGTPSVFINGRKLNGWTNLKFLRAVIEQELANQ